ncbi:hypothetical protein ACFE04_003290 [Oxalis oulophora]
MSFFDQYPGYARWREMVHSAITSLNESNGSSADSIYDYIRRSYLDLPECGIYIFFSEYLEKMRGDGYVVSNNRFYKLYRPNGEAPQDADNITNPSIPSVRSITLTGTLDQKLQDGLQELGKKIKSREDHIKALKATAVKLDDSILDLQVTLGKYHSRDRQTVKEDLSQGPTEEEITEQILQQNKSAAGILYKLKTHHSSQVPWTKEVLGVVATLGKVDDENLSRLLSEYLGLENMLAIVCRTFEGIKDLETYDMEGAVNKEHGLHGLGVSIGRIVEGRYHVICLDSLRHGFHFQFFISQVKYFNLPGVSSVMSFSPSWPYAGDFIADDPQKRLDLLKPKLPNGESPPGFLGFAVNMIKVDSIHSYYLTQNGHGLRETLFYNLLSRLQVYKTRADMLFARPCISNGAISLDGGMIKTSGLFSLGDRGDVKITFPKSCVTSSLPESYYTTEKQLKEQKWHKEKLLEDLKREQAVLESAKNVFAKMKDDFVKCLAHTGIYATQADYTFASCEVLEICIKVIETICWEDSSEIVIGR